MDEIIVGIIVAGAVVFTIKSFVTAYRKKSSCDCGGCSCSSKKGCPMEVRLIKKNI